MRGLALVASLAAGLTVLAACQTSPERPGEGVTQAASPPETSPPPPAAPIPTGLTTGPRFPEARPVSAEPVPEPVPELAPTPRIVTVQAEEPRYLPPESLKKFRYAKPPAEKAAAPATPPGASIPRSERVELPVTAVATVTATPDEPRYKLPESLAHWHSGRKVPLYADPDAAPWQATPTEPRLQNAAVSCNYKDEGGVRGKAMLLVDNHRLTRFTARIEMPNGGVCQFDSKKMAQRPFEQGIALQSNGDECVVRMWEQKHRITIAAYSCHKQCSKGSFSYLWPIIMDTRVGTCY